MEQEYDYILVLASLAVACLTSFLAIAFASFIIWHDRYKSCLWTYGAAVNMGMGIWTMHFIGMMAMHLDTPVRFDTIQTIISALFAIVGSYVTFKILLDPSNYEQQKKKVIAAFALGTSVIAMHYIGMSAMQMFPQPSYDSFWVAISIIIAYSASYVGLEIFIRSSKKQNHNVFDWQNLFSALIIGFAITSMHYTGMIAAEFDPNSYCTVKRGIDGGIMSYYIIGVILMILTTSLMFIIYEQGMDTKRARKELEELNASLENQVEERTKEIKATLNNLQQTQQQLIESEKMASLGGLVAGVAHEVNTPLGVSLTSSSFLKEEIKNLQTLFDKQALTQTALTDFLSVAGETSEIIEKNLTCAADLISNFKKLAVDQSNLESAFTFNIYETINSSLTSLNHVLKKSGIESTIHAPQSDLQAYNYSGALSQVITNLIMNANIHAFDETVESPNIEISVSSLNDEHIEIIFKDNGKGMPKEVLKKIFEPFFTTRRGDGGSGLGMHLVYNIVSQTMQGKIKAESVEGEGTTFTIVFPMILKKKR